MQRAGCAQSYLLFRLAPFRHFLEHKRTTLTLTGCDNVSDYTCHKFLFIMKVDYYNLLEMKLRPPTAFWCL
jgi:hypothetical protein